MNADRLVRLYPRWWRERYAEEFVETVGRDALSARQVVDIVMNAIDARLSAELRQAARVRQTAERREGDAMSRLLKTVCADAHWRMGKGETRASLAIMLAASFLVLGAGVIANKSGHRPVGTVLVSLAYPVGMALSLPFGLLRDQPWRAQSVVIGITLGILVGSGWLSLYL